MKWVWSNLFKQIRVRTLRNYTSHLKHTEWKRKHSLGISILLISEKRVPAHLNLRTAQLKNIKRNQRRQKRNIRNVIFQGDLIYSAWRFILLKYCVEFTSVALNYDNVWSNRQRDEEGRKLKVKCSHKMWIPPWQISLCWEENSILLPQSWQNKVTHDVMYISTIFLFSDFTHFPASHFHIVDS